MIGLHVSVMVFYYFWKKENLVSAMIAGKIVSKDGRKININSCPSFDKMKLMVRGTMDYHGDKTFRES